MKKLLLLSALAACTTRPTPKPEEPIPNNKAAVVWLNGTGANCLIYPLRQIRAKGYQVECPESRNTGDGLECLQKVDKLVKQGVNNIGIMGHSQGGGGSFVCASRAERKYPYLNLAVIGVEPAHGFKFPGYQPYYKTLNAPSFQWYGTRDRMVPKSWVRLGYSMLNGEKYLMGAVGAAHIPSPNGWIVGSTVFFDWKLKGSTQAEKEFKALPNSQWWER